jgi:hypothetical protein
VRAQAEQVPAIAFAVEEDGHAAVRFRPRRPHERDARGRHALVRGVEVVDVEKQSHAARELVADRRLLPVAIRACEQDARLRVRRSHHHPALRASVVRERRRVLDQRKAEDVHEEVDRAIVVANDEGDEVHVHGGT